MQTLRLRWAAVLTKVQKNNQNQNQNQYYVYVYKLIPTICPLTKFLTWIIVVQLDFKMKMGAKVHEVQLD